MFDADLAVIGAGPAGLAAAIAARRLGMRVIVFDARTPPIDKACGEGLLPDAIEAARRLGLQLPAEAGAIEGIRFLHAGRVLEASFRATAGRAFRRTILSQALVSQALLSGVDLRWGVSVHGVDGQVVHTRQGQCSARWIAAADGERSAVRRWLGLDTQPATTRYAFRRHFLVGPWTNFVEVYWGPGLQTYVTPLDGQVGVAVISDDPSTRVAQALAAFPSLTRRLRAAGVTSVERGAVTTARKLSRVTHGRLALLGDASGSVDAITGDGIGLAFQQAELLAASLADGDLRRYEAGHAALSRRALWMGRALTALAGHPSLTNSAMSLLGARPSWFQRLVQFHVAENN